MHLRHLRARWWRWRRPMRSRCRHCCSPSAPRLPARANLPRCRSVRPLVRPWRRPFRAGRPRSRLSRRLSHRLLLRHRRRCRAGAVAVLRAGTAAASPPRSRRHRFALQCHRRASLPRPAACLTSHSASGKILCRFGRHSPRSKSMKYFTWKSVTRGIAAVPRLLRRNLSWRFRRSPPGPPTTMSARSTSRSPGPGRRRRAHQPAPAT